MAYMLVASLCLGGVNNPVYAEGISSTEAGQVSETLNESGTIVDISEEADSDSWDGKTTENVFEAENYKVYFTLAFSDENGYNANVKIENTGDSDIQNWYLRFDNPNSIKNIWNAEIYLADEEECTVKNASWNQDIAAGSSVEFGISGDQAFTGFPERYVLLSTSVELSEGDYGIQYAVENEWNTGFCSTITITNNTSITLEDWELAFDCDREITGLWNGAIIEQKNGHYLVRNAGNNANIQPGASVSFDIQGCKDKNEGAPKNYQLYTYNMVMDRTIDETLDSDGDGVLDYLEECFGSNRMKVDTDEDGLSDYIEIYITSTDPALVDTDGNGIADADEDADGDGLTNLEELLMGTELDKADSDNDGLNDYEEINKWNTDPCKYDTDEDGLSDGDEILLGLDPLTQKTDGATPDSERKIAQEIVAENFDDLLTSDENAAIPSLTLVASGNVNKRVSVTTTKSASFSDSRAIVGEPIDISGENIGTGTIHFKLANSLSTFTVKDTKETYCSNLVCKYNEDGETEYLDTEADYKNNSITAAVDGEGTYFVLDVKSLFHELGFAMPTTSKVSSVAKAKSVDTYSVAQAEALSVENASVRSAESNQITNVMAQADVVFIIDTTSSMGEEIKHVKQNVESFVDALKAKGISAGLALIDYQDIEVSGLNSTKVHKNGDTNWFYDMKEYKKAIASLGLGSSGDKPECAVDALETGRQLDMRASAEKLFILVTDANYKVANTYGIASMEKEIELLKNDGITCAVVSPASEKRTYSDLYNKTNGIWADINGDFSAELMKLADKFSSDVVGDGYWVYLDGPVPVPVQLDGKPKNGSAVDSDNDGVSDIEELGKATEIRKLNLDRLVTKASNGDLTGTTYGTVSMYQVASNPVETDSDYDGIIDNNDANPNSNSFKGKMHYDYDGKSKTCNIDFSMDYRKLITGSNTMYSKDLAKLAILYASDVYSGNYIEFTEGAKGGNDTPTTFGTILGLKDTQCYKIKSSDYAVDKDDVTEFFVGHRKIAYNGTDTEVIVVAVRGTNGTNEEWSSNFDVGADTSDYYARLGSSHPDWRNKLNHKGFDVAANRVNDKLKTYINTYVNSSASKSILITGHSRGAAIANILGQKYEDDSSYRSYTYTFATPNSTTSSSASRYKTIFNVVNEDDIIPYLPLSEWGFKNYGITKSISINENYENKWGSAEVGTWEWLIGKDYNDDGGTQRTLNCFSKIANNRADLYKLDTSKDGKVWENNWGHVTKKGANKELSELTEKLREERLLRFCKLYVVGGGFLYHVEVNYCPAYLMQTLSNMTTGTGPMLGRDTKGKYAQAKTSFVASSGKLIIGGMTDPHMPPTYYLIARNDFKSI